MGSSTNLRLALAQVNTTVGAVAENAALISEWIARARDEGAELVLFPELCLPGYPAEDLYLKRHFLQANADALGELAAAAEGIAVLVGFAEPRTATAAAHPFDAPTPRAAHNALALLDGLTEGLWDKTPRIDLRTVVEEGNPVQVLVEQSAAADLVVVGSRGHGGFAGMLLGSVSHHLVAHSKCPVVVVR